MNYALFKRATYGILIRLGGFWALGLVFFFCVTTRHKVGLLSSRWLTLISFTVLAFWRGENQIELPASFRSRIRFQSDSAFRTCQFSILAEKLRKNLYSRKLDILRCIFCRPPSWCWDADAGERFFLTEEDERSGEGGAEQKMYRRRPSDAKRWKAIEKAKILAS